MCTAHCAGVTLNLTQEMWTIETLSEVLNVTRPYRVELELRVRDSNEVLSAFRVREIV